jgi:hypothetical protein
MRLAPASLAILALAAATATTAGAGGRSSPSACANAWNHGASSSIRARIVARKPTAAFVSALASVTSISWTKTTESSTSGPGCSIRFILGNGHTLAVFGPWADNGRISRWSGPVASNRAIRFPRNSNVHADGTVGFHG